jgi:LysM repeat protein
VIYPGQKLLVYGGKSTTSSSTPSKSTVNTNTKKTYYTVKQGDTLWKIASANGVTVDNIKKANGLKSDNLHVGQKLLIN